MKPGPAEPDERVSETLDVAHAFCRDVVNRKFEGLPYGSGKCELVVNPKVFAADRGEDLRPREAIEGCRPVPGQAVVTADCSISGPQIGALQNDGSLFDIDIPGAGYLGSVFQP